MIRRRRNRRRNRVPLAVLALTAIFASVFVFRCFIPSSSESSSKCGGSECTAEVAGVSLTATPPSQPDVSFQGTTPPPSISALSAVVIEDSCGEVLFAKDPHRRLPPGQHHQDRHCHHRRRDNRAGRHNQRKRRQLLRGRRHGHGPGDGHADVDARPPLRPASALRKRRRDRNCPLRRRRRI